MTSCDSRNFIFKGQASGTDSAKENMFLFGLQLHRIINIQEFSITPGKQCFVNGAIIKSICSGGDRIETRQHYGMPVRMRMQATLLFAANEYPDFSPANTLETCTVWAMVGRFVDASHGMIEQSGFMNYPSDNTIKDFIKQPDVGLAFIHILITALSFSPDRRKYPDEIRAENISADETLDSSSVIDSIRRVISFTGNPGDMVSNSRVKTALNIKNIVIGKMALAKLLKNLGAEHCRLTNNERGYSGIIILS
jgi:hypothetical protein